MDITATDADLDELGHDEHAQRKRPNEGIDDVWLGLKISVHEAPWARGRAAERARGRRAPRHEPGRWRPGFAKSRMRRRAQRELLEGVLRR